MAYYILFSLELLHSIHERVHLATVFILGYFSTVVTIPFWMRSEIATAISALGAGASICTSMLYRCLDDGDESDDFYVNILICISTQSQMLDWLKNGDSRLAKYKIIKRSRHIACKCVFRYALFCNALFYSGSSDMYFTRCLETMRTLSGDMFTHSDTAIYLTLLSLFCNNNDLRLEAIEFLHSMNRSTFITRQICYSYIYSPDREISSRAIVAFGDIIHAHKIPDNVLIEYLECTDLFNLSDLVDYIYKIKSPSLQLKDSLRKYADCDNAAIQKKIKDILSR